MISISKNGTTHIWNFSQFPPVPVPGCLLYSIMYVCSNSCTMQPGNRIHMKSQKVSHGQDAQLAKVKTKDVCIHFDFFFFYTLE